MQRDNNMKIISIIIPCYNVENSISFCIESLHEQNLGLDDMEWILINDASIDRTWSKILELEQKYPENIIAVNCDVNGRQGKARNIGLSYASGEYIGFIDGDDWVEPAMYFDMISEIQNSQGDIVSCKIVRDKERGISKHQLSGTIQRLLIDTDEKRKQFICSSCLGYSVCNKVFRKKFLEENQILFPENVVYEDVLFSSLYYLYAKNVSLINCEYYHYVVNEQSTVLKMNQTHHLDIITIIRRRIEEYRSRGVLEKYSDELELDLIISGYLEAMKIFFLRYEKVPYEAFIQLKQFMNQELPDAVDNKYIKDYIPEKYLLLVELLKYKVSQEKLELIASDFRKI